MEKNNTFAGLAQKQVNLFQNNNLAWVAMMVKSWTIQEIMGLSYGVLVRAKKIKKMEDLDDQEALWATVDEYYKGEPDEKIRNRIAISLITLEYYLT